MRMREWKNCKKKALTNEIESHVHKVVVVGENFSFNNPGDQEMC